jgi:endonuclease/exonuclease/phosphatase family metal-dependent hydrolase
VVRVATLNLLNNTHGRWPHREPLVIDQARAVDADVYAFQEVDATSDQIERIRSGISGGGGGGTYEAITLPNPNRTSIKSLAILTRLPVVDVARCTDLPADDLALRVDVEVGDQRLHVTTTHFHFSPTRSGSEVRRLQAEQLLRWLGPIEGPTVVLGDFNSRHSGSAIATMKQHFRSAHEHVHGTEPDATHPTPLVRALDVEKAYGVPLFPEGAGAAVDYVFVGGGVEVDSCAVAWDEPSADEPDLYPSDHFGLVADLRLP